MNHSKLKPDSTSFDPSPADKRPENDPWADIFGADEVDTSILDKLDQKLAEDEQDELEE